MRRPSILVAILAVIGLTIICLTILIGLHRDTSAYITTVSPIIATLLGLFVVSRQVDDVRDMTSNVQTQTNGKLDKRFKEVNDKLDAVTQKMDEGNVS